MRAIKQIGQYAVKFIKILPFSVEGPSPFHDDYLEHVLDEVVEFVVLLDEGSDYLHIHDSWIAESDVGHIE